MPGRTVSALGIILTLVMGCGSTTIVEGAPDDTSATGSTSGSTGGQGGMGGEPVTTGTGSGAGGSGGGVSEGDWRADLWIGQVDHLSLRHHALEEDLCLLITATAPSQAATYDVDIPEPWAVDMISAYDDTAGCLDDPFTPQGEPVFAEEALGAITFEVPAMQFYPCELDVDIEASFPMSTTPQSLLLKASMVAVGGACD